MYLRVDDRLVHGQVVTAWLKQLKVKRVLVVDDNAASNKIVSKALTMACPRGVALKVVDTETGKAACPKVGDSALIIVKAPATARDLVVANPDLGWTVCVGNVGSAEGRETYADTVHLDAENYAAVQEMLPMEGVDVFMQTVPGQPVNRF